MADLVLLSDTHVPSRAREIPQWVRSRIEAADHVVHAGDFDSAAAYETVHGVADGDLTAVRGNTDPRSLDLPRVAAVDVGGVRFVVTHGHGRGGYHETVARAVREEGGDVGVSGHTHELRDETEAGVRYLNPGSATGTGPAQFASLMTVSAEDGGLDVEVHRR